jgi:signal transduction histidine kinase
MDNKGHRRHEVAEKGKLALKPVSIRAKIDITPDWKLLAGFSALLFLILIIGVIAIVQIRFLSKSVDALGKYYFIMQKSALEMRVNNSSYAMAVRNYVFWHSAKYLEAAAKGTDKKTILAISDKFEKSLLDYERVSGEDAQDEYLKRISMLYQELKKTGDTLTTLADKFDGVKDYTKKRELEDSLNRQMMLFESTLHRIDEIIETGFLKANLENVSIRLKRAEAAKNNSIMLLIGSMLFCLGIGSETAYVVYRGRRIERQNRQDLVRRMIRMEEEERQNLSFQVHDQMGQDLSALRIYLDIINSNMPGDNEELKKSIAKGKGILSSLVEKSHNIAELLRPPALNEIGLIDTLADLVEQYAQVSSIKLEYRRPSKEMKISDEYSLVLYRTVQEALTNIIKHSQAKTGKVVLKQAQGGISLVISDDGAGFDYEAYLNVSSRRREDKFRLGIAGVRERVILLGGTAEIKTAPGKGTRISIFLP